MSLFGGGSQGQIRYSLILDDQATGKINSYKTALTGLNTTTQQSTNFTKQLGAGLGPLANNYKNASSAVADMTTQQKSVGGTITANISKFANFATGLSATASGALQLAAGFRDYNDAQIQVDRVTRRVSLANESLTKAQDKLNVLISKGIKSGKDYEQAQLDVRQADEQLKIQTQLLGEAQEHMFDSQTQFATAIIPTTLGAIGTLGSAFKDLGLNMGDIKSKITGLIGSKGGLGLLGLAGAAGFAIAGIQEIFSLMARKQRIQALDDIINAGNATIDVLKQKIEEVKGLKQQWGVQLEDWFFGGTIGKMIRPETTAKIATEVIKSLESEISRKDAIGAWQNVLINILNNPRISDAAKTSIQKQITHIETVLGNEANWKAGYGSTAEQVAANTKAILLKAEDAVITDIRSGQISAKLKEISVTIGEGLTGATREAFLKANKGAEFNFTAIITKAFAIDPKAIAQIGDPIGKLAAKVKNFGTGTQQATTIASSGIIKLNDSVKNSTNIFGVWNDEAVRAKETIIKLDPALQNTMKVYAKMPDLLKTWEDADKTATAEQEKHTAALNKAKQAYDDFRQRVDKARESLLKPFGIKPADVSKFDKQLKKMLPDKVEKHVKLDLKFQESVSGVRESITKLLEEASQLSDSDADRIAKTVIKFIDKKFGDKAEKAFPGLKAALQGAIADPNTPGKLDEILQKYNWSSTGGFIGGEIATALQKEVDWKAVGAAIGEGMQKGLDKHPLTPTVKAGPLWDIISGGQAGQIENITPKNPRVGLGKGPKIKGNEFNTGSNYLSRAYPQMPKEGFYPQGPFWGTVPGDVWSDDPRIMNEYNNLFGNRPNLSNRSSSSGGPFGPVSSGGGGGGKMMPTLTINTSKALQALGVVATNIQNLAKIIPVITLQTAKALQAVGVIAINTNNLAKIQPLITVINSKALQAIGVIAKNIDSLAKLKPIVQVQNSKALKAVGVIASHIDDLARIKPTLQVKNSTALKAVGVIAQHIQDLEKLQPVVHVTVKQDKITAQHGFHGTLSEDTMIFAHRGERVDIGHGAGGSGGGSSRGGGDINIELTNVLFDERIVRKFTARQGRNRYSFG